MHKQVVAILELLYLLLCQKDFRCDAAVHHKGRATNVGTAQHHRNLCKWQFVTGCTSLSFLRPCGVYLMLSFATKRQHACCFFGCIARHCQPIRHTSSLKRNAKHGQHAPRPW